MNSKAKNNQEFKVSVTLTVPQYFFIDATIPVIASSPEEAKEIAEKLSGKDLAKIYNNDSDDVSVDEDVEFDFNGIYEAIKKGTVTHIEAHKVDAEED